jgi:protein SCO1/2
VPGELKGHWTVVFLGFTHCPDICPTTLAELAQAQKQWADLPDPVRPRVLFVSVDPERDTPDRIGEYAHAFHRDTLAATADIPSLEAFARSLSLVFMKVPAADGAPASQYSVDHSAALAVLDPQGRMAGVIQPPLDPQAIAADLLLLTRATHP